MLEIIDNTVSEKNDFGFPLFRLGFRPFFFGAGAFAVIAMMLWMANYLFAVELPLSRMPAALWHAHEMLFGYTFAVIAGFLLTAIKNWTGQEVLRGKALAFLFFLWLAARLSLLSGTYISLIVTAVIDTGFMLLLILACMRPVLAVKQYKQVGIISKLFLLMICNVFFYLGVFEIVDNGIHYGLYSALYIVIALMLVMMRRVMPMFIQNGVDGEMQIINRAWLDNISLVLLLLLWLFDVFTRYGSLTAMLAAALAVVHTLRLSGWYSNKVWRKPLVWVLIVAYISLIVGFVLKAATFYFSVPVSLSLHAYTVGGIGLLTIGMMSRVSLGHTGRNIFQPPPAVFWIFTLLTLGAIIRVIFPLFDMSRYVYWIGGSQLLWLLAFSIFLFLYTPMFWSARVDKKDG